MPVRVASQSQTQPSLSTSYSLPSRMSNNSRTDDSGSGAEGSTRKRFHNSSVETSAHSRRPPASYATKGSSVGEVKSTFASRSRSVREQTAPLGPRPQDHSSAKSDSLRGLKKSNAHDPSGNSSTERLPEGFHTVEEHAAARDNGHSTGRTNYKQEPTAQHSNESFDFIPSVSFDELHSTISSDDYGLNRFPAPGSLGGPLHNGKAEGVAGRAAGQSIRNNASLHREQNLSRQDVLPSVSNSTEPLDAPLTAKARRLSHFHTPAPQLVTRAPRKSIGPGVIDSEFAKNAAQRRRPSIAERRPSVTDRRPSIETRESNLAPAEARWRGTPSAGHSQAPVPGPRLLGASRSVKAKSLQPPPRPVQVQIHPNSLVTDGHRSSSLNFTQSPAKSPVWRANTPSSSSSSKRLSVMPAHATGLGARTISPTDARRMKRLSMLQDPPPMPITSPTSQSDSTPAAPAPDQSPYLAPRKSVTPSSSRTTPEHNRKSISSGISSSSNTSFNTARSSTGSFQHRLSQSFSTSRLPTPKTNTIHCSTGEDEDVPPVPAIPKAYESPKENREQQHFLTRKSSLPTEALNLSSGSSTDSTTEFSNWTVPDRGQHVRQKRGVALGSSSDAESTTKRVSSMTRTNSKLVRLPPLNVQPLSKPTAAKVAALREPSSTTTTEDELSTPQQKKRPAKTPSTPMTASKATFFTKGGIDHESGPSAQGRSNSSSYAAGRESQSSRAPSNSSLLPSRHESTPSGRPQIAAHVPSGIPKLSGEAGTIRRKQSNESTNHSINPEPRTTRLNGPRSQTVSQSSKEESSTTTAHASEQDATSKMGLRRKLSHSFKRSPSKSSLRSMDQEGEQAPQPPRHDNMPPPRFPASATAANNQPATPNSPKPSWQLDSRRRKSSASSFINGHERTKSDGQSTVSTARGTANPIIPTAENALPPTPATRNTSSILSPMHKILGSKSSLYHIKGSKHGEQGLDRDDLAAEDEMKKLASKRKDFEEAAKELDELRRRATAKEPFPAQQVTRSVNLNIFEKGEILDYKDIYFWGAANAKKHVGDLNAAAQNFGYDDERGDYNIVNGDHLSYRYEIIDVLGKGSFGQVVRCLDHKTGGLVAVKIIRNKKRFHQQALVEVNILQKLREWDPNNKHCMINFTQSFYFRGHLCISTELLGINLYEFIKSNNFQGFSLKLIRRFTKQLLSSLLLLKAHNVIHCDLKPENVLLAHPVHSEIKVIDFGSSCFENEKVYTYIQSRFYRSPEVILGMSYGMPIDMWSLGCILAELFTGYPIFPGENEQEQLACIMEVFGPPEKHLIEKSTRKKLFFDSMGKPRLTVSSKGRRRRPSSKTLQQALKCDDDAFVDFLARCLRWDPERRIKPEEAMQHDFLTGNKTSTRTRVRQALTDAPAKRLSSVQPSLSSSRPLPEPPATSFKNGMAVRNREAGSSPVKSSTMRRYSTVQGAQNATNLKRSSTGATLSSNLPRVMPRNASTKPELAAAAAAAATTARR
ncbi:MAG: hypothetical protein M1825_002664 [Sarcosagium campestre]|nr:MAG: hypothetical protein M1825_002664 [Sarcosagium campestre]